MNHGMPSPFAWPSASHTFTVPSDVVDTSPFQIAMDDAALVSTPRPRNCWQWHSLFERTGPAQSVQQGLASDKFKEDSIALGVFPALKWQQCVRE